MSSAAADAAEPLVSVVIPTYERPQLLHEALASVVAQTYRALEIVVHDNASSADPGPVVASFADPRIAFYRNLSNIGQTPNIAAGLARARGKYVAVLADDDLWQPDMIASLVAPLERHPEAVIAFCDHDIVTRDGQVDPAASDRCSRRFGRDRLAAGLHRPFSRIALRTRSICAVSGALLRRDAAPWSEMPSQVWSGGDLYLAYLAARTGGACYYVKRRLMHFRVHAGSFSDDVQRRVDDGIRNARAAQFCWMSFLRDPGITESKPYFALKLVFNALRIALLRLRQHRADAAGRALAAARPG